MSALSSGDLDASLPEGVAEDVEGFLERFGLPDSAGCPFGATFPWPVVSRYEWMLCRVHACQVRSWVTMVENAFRDAVGADGTDDADSGKDGGHPEGGGDLYDEDGRESPAVRQVADRLAVEHTLTPQEATGDVRAALGLVRHLPLIMMLFERGRLDWVRARLIATRLHNPLVYLPDLVPGCPQWRIIEAALVVQAPSLTRPRLKRLVDRLLMDLAPGGAHKLAMAERRIWIEPRPHGMAFCGIILSAEAAQFLIGVLEAMADACRDQAAEDGVPDPRTHMQRCVDALIAIFTAMGEAMDIPIVFTPTNPATADDTPDPADATGETGEKNRAGTKNPQSPSDTHEEDGTQHSDEEPQDSPGHQDVTEPPDGSGETPQESSVLDDLLDEEETSHQRECDLFGITPLPVPPVPENPQATGSTGNGTAGTRRAGTAGTPMPAWWRLKDLPRKKGRGPHLVVTTTDGAWLGLDNTPALLRGYGAITAEQARTIGARADEITILVLPANNQPSTKNPDRPDDPRRPHDHDERGQECAYGQDHTTAQATRYRPSRFLTDLVTAIWETCTFPGCARTATHCDLDHVQPFGQDGATCICKQILRQ